MMNILHFSQSVKWSSWFICSLLLHGLIFLAFIWRFSEVQPAMSPAPAIMLQWAEIIEAPSSPLSLPVGIAQQESAVTDREQSVRTLRPAGYFSAVYRAEGYARHLGGRFQSQLHT
ncbi:TPA: hypothetical protein ACGSXD_004793 [Escherichia coli]